MAFNFNDRLETTDGSRPDATVQTDATARAIPLSAFTVLRGGDTFESKGARPPADAEARAKAYIASHIRIIEHGAEPRFAARIVRDIARQLGANRALVARLVLAKPIHIDIIPPHMHMAKFGYPRQTSAQTAGLFWNAPSWTEARIALRREHFDTDPTLVVHEMAHAVHYLAFTQQERDAIYQLLQPTFGQRWAMDEAFAIYTEREFVTQFDTLALQGPGVYGAVRRDWSEDHVFTRFVRKLYFPHKPLAGHKFVIM